MVFTKFYANWNLFSGVVLKEITISFPATSEEIIQRINETLEEGTRLALFGHIPSNYPIVMPVEEIVQLCHKKGVPVLIDGAHALGTLPLNLTVLKADYYVGNAHKWLTCPKVCFSFLVKLYIDLVLIQIKYPITKYTVFR